MKIDIHMHSDISYDAKASIDKMCRSAINKGLSIICFTEHFDLNPNDDGCNYFNLKNYNYAIEKARDKYSDKILILKGLEFSEPHLYPEELDKFNKMDFDFILGSIHCIIIDWFYADKKGDNWSLEELFTAQYEETLRACRHGMFDSLAHMDFPKRYLKNAYEPLPLINEILSELISKDISLELNSSPLRKGCDEQFPSGGIINRYLDLGGKYFTIGSDSHDIKEISADFEKITITNQMKICYYQKRKRQILNSLK